MPNKKLKERIAKYKREDAQGFSCMQELLGRVVAHYGKDLTAIPDGKPTKEEKKKKLRGALECTGEKRWATALKGLRKLKLVKKDGTNVCKRLKTVEHLADLVGVIFGCHNCMKCKQADTDSSNVTNNDFLSLSETEDEVLADSDWISQYHKVCSRWIRMRPSVSPTEDGPEGNSIAGYVTAPNPISAPSEPIREAARNSTIPASAVASTCAVVTSDISTAESFAPIDVNAGTSASPMPISTPLANVQYAMRVRLGGHTIQMSPDNSVRFAPFSTEDEHIDLHPHTTPQLIPHTVPTSSTSNENWLKLQKWRSPCDKCKSPDKKVWMVAGCYSWPDLLCIDCVAPPRDPLLGSVSNHITQLTRACRVCCDTRLILLRAGLSAICFSCCTKIGKLDPTKINAVLSTNSVFIDIEVRWINIQVHTTSARIMTIRAENEMRVLTKKIVGRVRDHFNTELVIHKRKFDEREQVLVERERKVVARENQLAIRRNTSPDS